MILKEFKKSINDKDFSSADECPVIIKIRDQRGRLIKVELRSFGMSSSSEGKVFHISVEIPYIIG